MVDNQREGANNSSSSFIPTREEGRSFESGFWEDGRRVGASGSDFIETKDNESLLSQQGAPRAQNRASEVSDTKYKLFSSHDPNNAEQKEEGDSFLVFQTLCNPQPPLSPVGEHLLHQKKYQKFKEGKDEDEDEQYLPGGESEETEEETEEKNSRRKSPWPKDNAERAFSSQFFLNGKKERIKLDKVSVNGKYW